MKDLKQYKAALEQYEAYLVKIDAILEVPIYKSTRKYLFNKEEINEDYAIEKGYEFWGDESQKYSTLGWGHRGWRLVNVGVHY